MLGGLTIHPPVANFPWRVSAKNYESWLKVVKVSVTNGRNFFYPSCIFIIKDVQACWTRWQCLWWSDGRLSLHFKHFVFQSAIPSRNFI